MPHAYDATDMDSNNIVWEDPPEYRQDRTRPGVWEKTLTPLMEHPGRWARVGEYSSPSNASSTAFSLRRRLVRMPPGAWEFRASGRAVFARYIGETP